MLVSEFFNKELNSLKFYNELNTSYVKDDLGWFFQKTCDLENVFSKDTIDYLTYLLLIKQDKQDLWCNIDLHTLSKSYSQKYFDLINNEDIDIELKLKCQRLNYIIQLHLDKDKSQYYEAEFFNEIEYFFPWDIEVVKDNLIVVESKDTIRYNNERVDFLSNNNFMLTQVDRFDEKIIFNSCYSSYIATVNLELSEHKVEQDNNCLFMFYYDGFLSKVTIDYNVIIDGKNIGSLGDTNKPWRFRVFENYLFVFDWYKFGSCIIFNLDFGNSMRHHFTEMWIPHDIVRVDDKYYLLDKQQGMIFIYDLNFKFINNLLSFGYNKGQLCDPIGIKKAENFILVSSWLSGKINVVYV
ncbi:hypothetical protein [Flavobacterium notoginsengisoli]|uniref:hypothetical protein n=1 Tax=Flavobacterium notoginsengisoli TaxID=1478199 RepID=UPI00363A1A4C